MCCYVSSLSRRAPYHRNWRSWTTVSFDISFFTIFWLTMLALIDFCKPRYVRKSVFISCLRIYRWPKLATMDVWQSSTEYRSSKANHCANCRSFENAKEKKKTLKLKTPLSNLISQFWGKISQKWPYCYSWV